MKQSVMHLFADLSPSSTFSLSALLCFASLLDYPTARLVCFTGQSVLKQEALKQEAE